MKKVTTQSILIVLTAMMLSFDSQAQSYVFEYNQQELKEVQSTTAMEQHPFGEEVAYKFQLLKEQYTYKEANEMQQTTFNVVEKPSIYYSVKKANKHLIKSVKSGQMDQEEAIRQLTVVLDKALNIRYQNTDELEKVLWKVKDPVEITELYTKEIAMN